MDTMTLSVKNDDDIRELKARLEYNKAVEAYEGMLRRPYLAIKEDEFVEYCETDVRNTRMLYKTMNLPRPSIKKVIFNEPATIVLWGDGTKTVVKTQNGDEYDPEKGLAMAISKRTLGNDYSYYNVFKKWLKKHDRKMQKEYEEFIKETPLEDIWDDDE